MNIRTRLTLLFGLLVASILLLFSLTVYYLYDQFRKQEFGQRLEEIALTTVRLRQDMGQVPARDLPVIPQEHITIYNAANQILYDNGSARFPITNRFLKQIHAGWTIHFRAGDLEAVGFPFQTVDNQRLVVIASAYDRYGFSKLDRLREILLYGWFATLLVVGIAGWLFASDVLRPVSEIIEQVNAISATNIHQRLRVGRQRDELADLARTFNDMLARLEDAFVAQRSFVSHASHELRTPLTVMMGQLEVTLLQARNTAEYQATLEATLEEVRQMISLANGLLDLARASSDAAMLSYRPVRIDELLWQAQSYLLTKNSSYQIEIDFENSPEQETDLILPGEEMLLRTAFQNLMENGCKYSPDHRVDVRLRFDQHQLQLTFTDQGYGIGMGDLPHIFEPFYRAEATMATAGHGIGLALTQRIIHLHQGEITLTSQLGQGTTVLVTFPIQPNPPAGQSAQALHGTH